MSAIDVVVVNYRTPELLKKFIDSYQFQDEQSVLATELTVIDVDPTTDNYEAVSEYMSKYPFQINYWPIFYNCGYSGACNFAASMGDSPVIAFFNSDTELYSDTLETCYSILQSDDSYAIAGPMQVNSSGNITHAGIFGTNDAPIWGIDGMGWQSRNTKAYNQTRDDAITVSGSAFFVKRSVWNEMMNDARYRDLYPEAEGAFLPTPHYYEETWCSYFARHLGYKVVYVGETMMIHEWHKSSEVGSVEGTVMGISRGMFRDACDAFGIIHD